MQKNIVDLMQVVASFSIVTKSKTKSYRFCPLANFSFYISDPQQQQHPHPASSRKPFSSFDMSDEQQQREQQQQLQQHQQQRPRGIQKTCLQEAQLGFIGGAIVGGIWGAVAGLITGSRRGWKGAFFARRVATTALIESANLAAFLGIHHAVKHQCQHNAKQQFSAVQSSGIGAVVATSILRFPFLLTRKHGPLRLRVAEWVSTVWLTGIGFSGLEMLEQRGTFDFNTLTNNINNLTNNINNTFSIKEKTSPPATFVSVIGSMTHKTRIVEE